MLQQNPDFMPWYLKVKPGERNIKSSDENFAKALTRITEQLVTRLCLWNYKDTWD